MKRIPSFAILLFALLFAVHTKAQLLYGDLSRHRDSTATRDTTLPKAEFGIKLGANTQSISGETWDNTYTTGVTGGIWATLHKNKIGVRLEALISTFKMSAARGIDSSGNYIYAISDSAGNRGVFRGTYFDIPVLFEYSVTPGIIFQAGFQYSILLTLKDLTNISGNYITLFHQGEFSGLLGVEVKLPRNLSMGARFKYGFSNVNNTLDNNTAAATFPGNWKTTAFQLFACYKIK